MVVFTCQYCGESLQKPKVEKHYLTKCRHRSPSVTCVDCLKDFNGEDYVNHTNCLSEAERYAAHGTVFKESAGKNKQARYCEMIQNLLTSTNLTPVQNQLLKICSNHDNVPRKLKKFINFMKNVARQVRCNDNDLKSTFDILESAWQKENKSSALHSLNDNNQNLPSPKTLTESTKDIDNNILNNKIDDPKIVAEGVSSQEPIMNGNNVKHSGKKRKQEFNEYSTESLQTSVVTDESNNLNSGKKQKKLKRVLEQAAMDAEKQEHNINDLIEIETEMNEIVSDTSRFDWKGVIVSVLDSRSDKELSTKRLGKKVISQYQCTKLNDRTYEDLLPKFNKKLNKIKQCSISDGKVKLLV